MLPKDTFQTLPGLRDRPDLTAPVRVRHKRSGGPRRDLNSRAYSLQGAGSHLSDLPGRHWRTCPTRQRV